jgi:hypothetical protein
VNVRWHGLLEGVREAFRAREDIERCARVTLASRDGAIAVQVELSDGRFASRIASQPQDVVPTLEALLVVPEVDAQMPLSPASDSEADPSAPAGNPSTVQTAPARSAEDVPTERAATPLGHEASPSSPDHLRIELSLETGARIGDGQASVGIGALSFLDISGWLAGLQGRVDRYRPLAPMPPGADGPGPPDGVSGVLEVAMLGGRRIRLQSLSMDFLAGPAVTLQGTSTLETQTPKGMVTKSSSSTVPRLVVASRLNFGARSALRVFAGLDGELGPSGGDGLPTAPRLPVWTLGLALGATVGTQ